MILLLSSLPKTPSSQPIRADKTLLWQFGEDEDTIDEICGVHESIFTQQLGLQAPDDPKHRWLMIGSGIHRKCQVFGGGNRCYGQVKVNTTLILIPSITFHSLYTSSFLQLTSTASLLYLPTVPCCITTMNPLAIWVLGHPQCVELNEQDTLAAAALLPRGQLRDGRIRRLP